MVVGDTVHIEINTVIYLKIVGNARNAIWVKILEKAGGGELNRGGPI
jgi:hypothetical protein